MVHQGFTDGSSKFQLHITVSDLSVPSTLFFSHQPLHRLTVGAQHSPLRFIDRPSGFPWLDQAADPLMKWNPFGCGRFNPSDRPKFCGVVKLLVNIDFVFFGTVNSKRIPLVTVKNSLAVVLMLRRLVSTVKLRFTPSPNRTTPTRSPSESKANIVLVGRAPPTSSCPGT
ncbi:hypothetical protein F2P81_000035 [Scophthalmus maximus]|uniref:Uncharacterized protein n=1 Tax=Scophthalmus maximus TaxID=52904 RepID=A0A6A4TWI5_SCOMX|nr:hypothetical protein F2P81_000035 [Scophthalmus maximus]